MLATATHDTKLGEDVRARINVHLGAARRVGARSRPVDAPEHAPAARSIDGEPAPDRNDEYRFYQALVGCWPVEGDGGRPGAR